MAGPIYSVVVPTVGNRPSLASCIQAVLRQTLPPVDVLVVAAEPAVRPPWLPARARFLTAPASSAGQRNLGAQQAQGELVLFVDDDHRLADDFAEALLAAWLVAPHEVVGLAGTIVNDPRMPLLQSVVYCLLGLGYPAFRAKVSRLRWSGHVLSVCEPSADLPAGFLHSCCTAYRRDLLLAEPFDETFDGYVLGDDLDLSARMRWRGRLVHVPAARSTAAGVPSTMPADPFEEGRRHGELLAFYRWRHRGPWIGGTLCWIAANAGQIAVLVGRALRRRSLAGLSGYLNGLHATVCRIARGQCRRWQGPQSAAVTQSPGRR